MKLLLLRHGATAWSVTGQHTGLTDIELTPAGREQAVSATPLLRRALGTNWPGQIVSSPLSRARTTAELAFGGAPFTTSPNLLEMDYGDYEGLTPHQIRELRPGWDIWTDGCPNGETVHEVGERADYFLGSVANADGPVTAVAHGHMIRILAARALGLSGAQGQLFTLDTATLSCIEDVRGKRVIKFWNVSPQLLH